MNIMPSRTSLQMSGIKLISVVLVFVAATNSFTYVPVGYRGIATRFGGVSGGVREEGVHFKLPFIDGNKNIQKKEVEASAASRDLQSVSSKIAVNFSVEPSKAVELFRRVGDSYDERIVAPAIQESVKSVTARFTAEELITKRTDVSDSILAELRERVMQYGLTINDLNIIDFDFSYSFNQAIESKVTAEQNALAAKNKLEQIKYEAEQEIEASKGKAEAQRIEGEALRANPAVIELRAIEKWDGKLPTYMTGEQTPFVRVQ